MVVVKKGNEYFNTKINEEEYPIAKIIEFTSTIFDIEFTDEMKNPATVKENGYIIYDILENVPNVSKKSYDLINEEIQISYFLSEIFRGYHQAKGKIIDVQNRVTMNDWEFKNLRFETYFLIEFEDNLKSIWLTNKFFKK